MTTDPTRNVEVRDNPAEHRFEVFLGRGLAGFATYEERPRVLAILHTEIDPAFEGEGLGSALIGGVLDAARARGLAVLPICPFVKSYLKGHPEYVDLVPAAQRKRFGLSAPE
jgi:predicted GNAT family acetyltransferase